MIGPEKFINILWQAVSKAKSEATAVAYASNSGLTRYANNYVHQNLHTQNISVSIRAKIGKKVGVATTNGIEPDLLMDALKRAEAIAASSPEIPGVPPLPGPRAYRSIETFSPATASFSPEDRALAVKSICDLAKENGAVASGLLSTGYSELCVVSSIGLRSHVPLTKAELMTIIGDGTSSGYGAALSRNINDIDFMTVGKRAIDKCLAGKKRAIIEPGDYEVILEPAAVADALEWLSFIGLGSKSVEEGTSFLAGRKGERIASDSITIYDDGYDARALGVPFDFEGMPKMRVDFIKKAIAGSCVHDTMSAARAGTMSTGHAAPPSQSAQGAMPMNIVMDPGESNLEQMIQNVKKGILVTRFHYINGFIDTREGVLTGMTRDGTFLIENGQISAGLPNLRFMQSFIDALKNVQEISKERETCPSWWEDTGAFYTPALRIENFRFIGVQKEN